MKWIPSARKLRLYPADVNKHPSITAFHGVIAFIKYIIIGNAETENKQDITNDVEIIL